MSQWDRGRERRENSTKKGNQGELRGVNEQNTQKRPDELSGSG